jgi:hypothetical protein
VLDWYVAMVNCRLWLRLGHVKFNVVCCNYIVFYGTWRIAATYARCGFNDVSGALGLWVLAFSRETCGFRDAQYLVIGERG